MEGGGIRTLRSRTSKRPDDTVLRVEEHLEDMAQAPLDSWGSDRASSQAHFSNTQNTLEAEGAHPQSLIEDEQKEVCEKQVFNMPLYDAQGNELYYKQKVN